MGQVTPEADWQADTSAVFDLDIDLERPSAARMYDYWLGGAANLAVDRELADKMIAIDPGVVEIARANRSFLRRAVRYCVANGIRQFLDLGSGIPTVGNVHEVAQQADPSCRVAYVDIEGIAVAHSRELLRGNPLATVTQADLRESRSVLGAPGVTGLIDFDQPVALLALMVLQYFPDLPDHPADILARYRAHLTPGSLLLISHLTNEETGIDMTGLAAATASASTHAHLRSRAEITELLGDAEPVDPGVVAVPMWRPDDPYQPAAGALTGCYVAVAKVP
ncbi:MAG TPA: SAM-dependent methyltransferase [Pseudonocardiaceae bacterium]|jgi:SAM-dependent methyltransferase|nr:SAM-dependent methyltransferase [Pseudonocardiaceae bacterium]